MFSTPTYAGHADQTTETESCKEEKEVKCHFSLVGLSKAPIPFPRAAPRAIPNSSLLPESRNISLDDLNDEDYVLVDDCLDSIPPQQSDSQSWVAYPFLEKSSNDKCNPSLNTSLKKIQGQARATCQTANEQNLMLQNKNPSSVSNVEVEAVKKCEEYNKSASEDEKNALLEKVSNLEKENEHLNSILESIRSSHFEEMETLKSVNLNLSEELGQMSVHTENLEEKVKQMNEENAKLLAEVERFKNSVSQEKSEESLKEEIKTLGEEIDGLLKHNSRYQSQVGFQSTDSFKAEELDKSREGSKVTSLKQRFESFKIDEKCKPKFEKLIKQSRDDNLKSVSIVPNLPEQLEESVGKTAGRRAALSELEYRTTNSDKLKPGMVRKVLHDLKNPAGVDIGASDSTFFGSGMTLALGEGKTHNRRKKVTDLIVRA